MNNISEKIIEKINIKNSGILISSSVNKRYISGYDSTEGFVFITEACSCVLVDSRYYEDAKRKLHDFEIVELKSIEDCLVDLCKKYNIDKILIEWDRLTIKQVSNFRKTLEEVSVEIIDDDKLAKVIKDMRLIKSEYEIEKIISSQKVTDEAFSYILSVIRPGLTERQIAIEIEFFMKKLGAEKIAFDFIVVSGENTSIPHGKPSNRKLMKGDLVTIDIGAVLDGYCSDMTRTVAIGNVSDEKKFVYQTVLKAQKGAICAVKPGESTTTIDRVARNIISNAGYGDYFKHGTGHGVGLEIHECPYLSTRTDTILKPGMVITIEPGIYISSNENSKLGFGVRIEDMLVVSNSSNYQNFTVSDKNLIII